MPQMLFPDPRDRSPTAMGRRTGKKRKTRRKAKRKASRGSGNALGWLIYYGVGIVLLSGAVTVIRTITTGPSVLDRT